MGAVYVFVKFLAEGISQTQLRHIIQVSEQFSVGVLP